MPFPAATITANQMHGPPILGTGCPTVLIGNLPAWRVSDQHTCPVPNAPPPVGPGTPHGVGITQPPGAVTVMVGGPPLSRMTSQIMEPAAVVPLPPPNPTLSGCVTVLVP